MKKCIKFTNFLIGPASFKVLAKKFGIVHQRKESLGPPLERSRFTNKGVKMRVKKRMRNRGHKDPLKIYAIIIQLFLGFYDAHAGTHFRYLN